MIGGVHIQRFHSNNHSIIGGFFIDGRFECYTLENEKKAIDMGVYYLTLRKEDTPLTLKHRKAYGDWFKYHIEIKGVPGRDYLYFHSGNIAIHSDGCILLGDSQFNNSVMQGRIGYSRKATERIYKKIYHSVEQKEIPITII